MSTAFVDNLKCIFCGELFFDKEVLQEHFRKHGDPTFDKTSKNKLKVQNEVPTSTEKMEENELVGCDVCEEVFSSISKAITHKHKLHPDYDAKYFCPWCGKLFTMKHLYNKHLQTNHKDLKNENEKGFHCDSCSVHFHIPSAMLHHNKFFHRQDNDPNSIGSSKKIELFNQELISIYYCPFCGEEYNNKVNLNKHMEDDHGEENKMPEDVLRCPLCESFFYHLDAYELHLTFHSSKDLYSEQNELFNEITDFSLEAVPPIMEKVEDAAIDTVNNFLETIMDEEVGKVKSKKHKKHKKSKKEAITLDEFLNMNKDVFGDGLNVQGIEEVPTQMVLKKKFKGKKPVNNIEAKNLKVELSKLKKHGIIIKAKSRQKCPMLKVNTKQSNEHNNPTSPVVNSDPNDVITKLLRQGNNQIKIVKKSVAIDCENKQDSYQSNKIDSSSDYNESLENVSQICTNNHEDLPVNNDEIDEDIEMDEAGKNEEIHDHSHEDDRNKQSNSNILSEDYIYNSSETDIDVMSKNDLTTNLNDSTLKTLHNMGSQITIMPLNKKPEPAITENKNDIADQSDDNDNCDNNDDEDEYDDNTKEVGDSKTQHEQVENIEKISINAIKSFNLNKGITVKTGRENRETKVLDQEKKSIPQKSLEALKSLSKCITIKAASASNIKTNLHTDDLKEQEILKGDCNLDNDDGNYDADEFHDKSVPTTSKIYTNKSHTDILKRLSNVTARPITVSKSIPVQNKFIPNPECSKSQITKNQANDEIEILNIDDSDSDADADKSVKSKLSNINQPAQKPTHPIKINTVKSVPAPASRGLNKNVTVKSMSKQTCNYTEYQSKTTAGQECKKTVINRNYESKNVNIIKCGNMSKLAEEHKNLQNTIKNLRRHIMIKSKNESHLLDSQLSEEDDIDESKQIQNEDTDEQDSDSSVGRVKITELNENISDTEHQSDDESMPRVESPHDSNSNEKKWDDDMEEFSDIESKIKINPIKNVQQQNIKTARQPQRSPKLSFLNKEVTIKSVKPDQYSDDGTNCNVTPEPLRVVSNVKNSSVKPIINKEKQISRNVQSSKKTSTSSNQVSTVKTVKTYQSQTVIEEVTTTVTKTIRTVNTQQEVQNASQNRPIMRPQTFVNKPVNSVIGTALRHKSPAVGTKVRNYVPTSQSKPNNTNVNIYPSNKVVPSRPRLNSPRLQNLPNVRKSNPTPQNKPRFLFSPNTPLKVAPNITPSASTKRTPEEASGHFSCFKKPKESLFPGQDIPNTGEDGMVQYSSSKSSSSLTNVSKILKGNNVATTSQTRSESCSTSQQQIAKFSGTSGLKIVQTGAERKQMEEKYETTAPKNSALAALEKLQRQGLLIKKPKLDVPDTEDDNCSHSGSDEENCKE